MHLIALLPLILLLIGGHSALILLPTVTALTTVHSAGAAATIVAGMSEAEKMQVATWLLQQGASKAIKHLQRGDPVMKRIIAQIRGRHDHPVSPRHR